MTIARIRLYALTAVGGLFLVYQLLTQAMTPQGPTFSELVWILLVVPLYAVGSWLTWRLPTHPQPVRLLVAGTASMTTGALGTLVASQPQLINSPWFPVLSMLSLEASADGGRWRWRFSLAAIQTASSNAEWQRLTLRFSWVVLIGPPLALLASPVVPVSPWVADGLPVPNPYAVSWLAWLAEPAAWLAVNSWWALVVGVLVMCARFSRPMGRAGSDASPVRCLVVGIGL